MNHNRIFFSVLAVILVALLLTPLVQTIGHTSETIPRETQQNVTSNETGILDIDEQHNTINEGENKSLINATNNLNTQQNVTVELSNDVSNWSLSNGKQSKSTILSSGEQTTYYVSVSEVNSKKNATYYVKSQTDNFWFQQSRTVTVNPVSPRPLASADDTDTLQRITKSSIDNLSKTGHAVSPFNIDFDSDGRNESAYTNNTSDDITFIDKQGEHKTIQTGARNSKTRYWTGNWSNFTDGVFYVNKTNENIYHADYNGNITLVKKTSASGVAGKGDIDGDGTDELIFSGNGYGIKYLEPDVSGDGDSSPQQKNIGRNAGENNGIGLGSPADFNDSGTARIPYVNGNNKLMVSTVDGVETTITTGAERTSIAPNDWDGDGTPEILFVNQSTHALQMADLEGGTWDITTVTDSNGNEIIISTYTGVA